MRAYLMMLCLITLTGGILLATEMKSARTLAQSHNDAQKDVHKLAPGAPIERELAGGQVHTYQIALASGQYLIG